MILETPRTVRSLALAVLLTCAVLLLSGCVRFTSELTVSPANTVSGEYVVAVPDGTGATVDLTDQELAQELWEDTDVSGALPNATIDPYSDGGWSGIVVQFTDEPLSAFAPGDDHWGVTREGDEFVVSGTMSGGTFTEGDLDEGEVEPDIKVTLTFPGPVTEANGAINGRTVSWTITENDTSLTARADAQPASDRARTLAFLVFTIVVVAAIAYWWAGKIGRSRREMPRSRGTINR